MSHVGEIIYRDGRYTGELNGDKLPHGKGKLVYSQGESFQHYYDGQWVKGKAHGKGVQRGKIGADRSTLYLDFALDQMRAICNSEHQTADHLEVLHGEYCYEGTFVDDEMSGTGQFTFPNGDMYDGEWQHGYAHGHGMFMWTNGDMYQGEFRCMMKHGTGSYIFKDGTKYDGKWKDNMRHGWGCETFASSGNRYEGYFCHDVRHGVGYYYVNSAHADGGRRGHRGRKSHKLPGVHRSKSSSSLSPNGVQPASPRASMTHTSSPHFTIVEMLWEFGKLVSQHEIDAAPSVQPQEPLELKDDCDRALEMIDTIMMDKEIEEDSVFVEGILHWTDSIWTTVENLFVDVYFERVRLKTLQEHLAEIESVILDDKREETTTATSESQLAKRGQLKEEIVELERKLFRIDSSFATARLHGSSAESKIDISHSRYKNLLKLTRSFLTRLACVAEKMVLIKADDCPKSRELAKEANYAILQKANTYYCQELELKSEFKALGCDIKRTIDRSNRLVQMMIDTFDGRNAAK